jgi:prophage DNA circulation protein
MSWRNDLRPATFRGLTFEATELSRSGGRRLEVHEYPQREEHDVEDLGRSANRFSLRAFLAGEQYADAREALIAALEAGNPGELYHPWRGMLFVHVETWTVTDSSDALGSCTIDISFVLHQADARPLSVEVDAPERTRMSADAAVAAAQSLEQQAMAAIGPGLLPPVYRTQLQVALAAQDRAWASILGIQSGWLYTVGGDIAISRAFELLDSVATARALLRAILAPLAASSPSAGGRADSVAHAAFNAAVEAARVAMLGQASILIVGATFPTAREATETLDLVTAAFDEVRPTAPDDVDAALADLQTQVTDTLSDAIERSPRVAVVEVADTTPALVLAWELYGDVGREDEILRLNSVGNPATLVGRYEVLT